MKSRQCVNIKALSIGDKDEFTSLYTQYWNQVYSFSRLYLVNPDTAEEVVQEVFIKVWEAKETLRDDVDFKGFLFIVTRNLIFSKFRKDLNEDYYKLTVLNALEQSYTIEDELEAKDLSAYIDILIQNLPPRCKEIFILSRTENMSYKEIAEKLAISEKTVENQISKALGYLKKNLRLLSVFLLLTT